jgi:hypothetical protein
MLLVAAVAKVSGKTPLRLWLEEYGLDPNFYNSLEPLQRLLIDNEAFANLHIAEQKAQKRDEKRSLDKHPGLERRLSLEELAARQEESKN